MTERYDHFHRPPWNGDYAALFAALRAAVREGGMEPATVWAKIEWEDSTVTLDSLDASEQRIRYQPPRQITVSVATSRWSATPGEQAVALMMQASPELETGTVAMRTEGADWPRARRAEATAVKVLADGKDDYMAPEPVAADRGAENEPAAGPAAASVPVVEPEPVAPAVADPIAGTDTPELGAVARASLDRGEPRTCRRHRGACHDRRNRDRRTSVLADL